MWKIIIVIKNGWNARITAYKNDYDKELDKSFENIV